MTSTPPSASSSVNTAMRSPFRVLSGRSVATMPPMVASGSIGFRPPEPHAAERISAVRDGVDRAGLHGALEPPFVRRARVEILGERVQRLDAPLRRAYGEKGLDAPFADVFDRGEADPPALARLDGEPQLA